ncbi:hypothetical protein HPB50_015718 [Hyalomma asiaticum]|uniref:Uncharacterized protein n=1 Tax=Hyalomma asiaticum TaxID=266040 RepID=A0ACB7SVS6_HYAAI|nr:hypothetical protein HPB50_015718 [Hyalomma asiaticum]
MPKRCATSHGGGPRWSERVCYSLPHSAARRRSEVITRSASSAIVYPSCGGRKDVADVYGARPDPPGAIVGAPSELASRGFLSGGVSPLEGTLLHGLCIGPTRKRGTRRKVAMPALWRVFVVHQLSAAIFAARWLFLKRKEMVSWEATRAD